MLSIFRNLFSKETPLQEHRRLVYANNPPPMPMESSSPVPTLELTLPIEESADLRDPVRVYPEAKSPDLSFSALPYEQRVPWHLVVLALDDIDAAEKLYWPLKEVDKFLMRWSRFYLAVTKVTISGPHPYTVYPDGSGYRYDLHWTSLPDKWIQLIPPCSAILSLYKLYDRPPVHAGSTWSLPYGVPVNGRLREYAAIPTDEWWYNNQPFEGFDRRDAQVVTHEIVNTIQGKIEASPYGPLYSCGQLLGTPGDPAWKYESDRLGQVQPRCYSKLGQNPD